MLTAPAGCRGVTLAPLGRCCGRCSLWPGSTTAGAELLPAHFAPPARGAAPEGLRVEGVCATFVLQSIALAASAVAALLCYSLSSLAPPTSQVPGEGMGAWGVVAAWSPPGVAVG